MAKLKIRTNQGTEVVDLFEDTSNLENTGAKFCIRANNKIYYAQAVKNNYLNQCRYKGSGTAMKMIVDNEPVFMAKGNFAKPYDTTFGNYYEITGDVTQTIPASFFGNTGGVIMVASGAGGGAYTENFGQNNFGGTGYIERVEIPANLKTDVEITTQFIQTEINQGSKGSQSVANGYECEGKDQSGYTTCTWGVRKSNNAQNGALGGKNCITHISFAGNTKIITVYGGGGQGGKGGSRTIYNDCSPQTLLENSCYKSYSWTAYGTGGQGGLTGAGTGTQPTTTGNAGALGLSYNTVNLDNTRPHWIGNAKVCIYKYL